MLDIAHRKRAATLCIFCSNIYTEIKQPHEYANMWYKNEFRHMFKKRQIIIPPPQKKCVTFSNIMISEFHACRISFINYFNVFNNSNIKLTHASVYSKNFDKLFCRQ